MDDPTRAAPSTATAEVTTPAASTSPVAIAPWTARLPAPLRALAHGWWKVVAALVLSNYVPALVFAFFQNGLGGLLGQLTTWGLLAPVERADPPIFWTGAGVLVVLALAGLSEEIAEYRAKVAMDAALRRKVDESHATARDARATAHAARDVANEASANAERA